MPDATAGICSSPGSILPTSWRERSGADGEAKTLPPPLPSSSSGCVCPATMTASGGAIWQPWCSCDLLCAWLCHLGMSELLRGRFSSFPRAKTPLGHLPANHASRFQCVHPFLHSALVTVAGSAGRAHRCSSGCVPWCCCLLSALSWSFLTVLSPESLNSQKWVLSDQPVSPELCSWFTDPTRRVGGEQEPTVSLLSRRS